MTPGTTEENHSQIHSNVMQMYASGLFSFYEVTTGQMCFNVVVAGKIAYG